MLSSELITDCLAGKEDAIQTLVRTHQRNIFQLALSIIDTANAPLAETIEQAEVATRDTFIVVLDRLGRYREDSPFEIWLYHVAYQVCLRRAKIWRRKLRWRSFWGGIRKKRVQSEKIGPEIIDKSQLTALDDPHQLRLKGEENLWRAVCSLNDQLRIPVVLRYYHDFSIDKIAKILKVSEGVVHARLDMAREKLAERKTALPVSQGPTN